MFDKTVGEHRDILGRVVQVGDRVSFVAYNGLFIGTVIKLTKHRVRIKRIHNERQWVFQSEPARFLILGDVDKDITTWLLGVVADTAKNGRHLIQVIIQ